VIRPLAPGSRLQADFSLIIFDSIQGHAGSFGWRPARQESGDARLDAILAAHGRGPAKLSTGRRGPGFAKRGGKQLRSGR
jgi:hypothetical protein